MHVVYSDAMVAPAQGYSPSAAKPAAVVAAWRAAWPHLAFREPVPVELADFYRVHEPSHVDAVLALKVPNGFGTRSPEVNASLPFTSGALLTAARWALSARTAVAAPVSGFHHAGYASSVAYCTFNGLMVTALALKAERPGLRVGILDYDYHYGDGTDDILQTLKPPGIVNITAGEHWIRPEQANAFLAEIPRHLEAMAECDLVLYQAGADPHIDDPLGGFLTTTQMAQRDWRVFNGLKERGIPVAWVLAGGYQTPISKVIDLHVNTMRAALTAHSV